MEHLYQFFSHPQKWSEERIERGDWGIRADEAKMWGGGEVAGLESEMDVGLELELEVLKELCRDESAPN